MLFAKGCVTRRTKVSTHLSSCNLKRRRNGCWRDHDIADKDARIVRRERGAGEIRASEGDIDRFAGVAGVRRKGRDGRSAYATRVAGDGEQISNGVVRIRRDIALPVDHLREPAEVVVDILRLVSNGLRRHNSAEHQHTGHSRQ